MLRRVRPADAEQRRDLAWRTVTLAEKMEQLVADRMSQSAEDGGVLSGSLALVHSGQSIAQLRKCETLQ